MRTKSETRKQAIVDTAKEIFCQQGYENTSMSEIASRVGGSKATLYSYFASKEEIFSAVMRSGEGEISAVFLTLKTGLDVEDCLHQFGMNYLHSILQPDVAAIRRLAIHEADRSAIGKHFYEQGPKIGWKIISDYMASLIEQQVLSAESPWVCAMHLKGLLEAEIVEECALGVSPIPSRNDLTDISMRAVRVFLKAYRAS